MPELRVPPATTRTFERLVTGICNRARLETEDWPLRAHELLNHLQDRWREGIEAGLTTEAAEERALQLFGKPGAVARRMKERWWKRLLLQRRFRLHRNLVYVSSAFIGQGLCALFVKFYENNPQASHEYAVGSILFSLLPLACAWVVSWKPKITNVLLRWLFALRNVLWLSVVSGFLNELFISPILLRRAYILKELPDLEIGWACFMVAAGIYGCVGGACLLSEALNLAGRRRQVNRDTFAFQVIR